MNCKNCDKKIENLSDLAIYASFNREYCYECFQDVDYEKCKCGGMIKGSSAINNKVYNLDKVCYNCHSNTFVRDCENCGEKMSVANEVICKKHELEINVCDKCFNTSGIKKCQCGGMITGVDLINHLQYGSGTSMCYDCYSKTSANNCYDCGEKMSKKAEIICKKINSNRMICDSCYSTAHLMQCKCGQMITGDILSICIKTDSDYQCHTCIIRKKVN